MAKKKSTKKKTRARKQVPVKGSVPKKKAARRGKKRNPGAEAPSAKGLELRMVAAGELQDHPENWRVHPPSQVAAFEAVMGEVGFVGYVVVNRRTGHVLDGHMRKEAVPPESLVPVLFGDWSEEEERLVLATFNPLGDLAGLDVAKGQALLDCVVSSEPAVQALLEGLEQDVERALAKAKTREPAAERDERDEQDGDAEAGSGGSQAKEVQAVHRVMIECSDKLDQLTLVQRFKAEGYEQVKACGGVV